MNKINLSFLLILFFQIQLLAQNNDSAQVVIQDDFNIMFFSQCLERDQVRKIEITSHNSLHLTDDHYSYRLEFEDVVFYIGEVTEDTYERVYWNKIISKQRISDGDYVLSGIKEFDYYSIDSGRGYNQVFHEVLVDGLFVCYYLKDGERNEYIEKCFQDFLWKYHGYRREYDQFPFIYFN